MDALKRRFKKPFMSALIQANRFKLEKVECSSFIYDEVQQDFIQSRQKLVNDHFHAILYRP